MYNFKEIYAQKDTDELLDIARKELTDEARTILNDILAHRGISDSVMNVAQKDADKHASDQIAAIKSLASLSSRFFAFLIDVFLVILILYIVLLPLQFISADLYINAVTITWLAYFLIRDSIPGHSFGKRILGIKVVQLKSGLSCNWVKSFGRNVTHIFFILDALFILSERNMRIGDMLAQTIVVKATEAHVHG
jgi:uncharacterized RDD family membrane protein YckC